MRKLVVLAIATLGLSLAACNTIEGAGRDVSAAGAAVTTTAQDVRN